MTHAHNLPGLGAHEFLLAVMHDPTVDLHDRMTAAEELCRAGLGDIGTIRTLRIVIEGGLGYTPTPEEASEVARWSIFGPQVKRSHPSGTLMVILHIQEPSSLVYRPKVVDDPPLIAPNPTILHCGISCALAGWGPLAKKPSNTNLVEIRQH